MGDWEREERGNSVGGHDSVKRVACKPPQRFGEFFSSRAFSTSIDFAMENVRFCGINLHAIGIG